MTRFVLILTLLLCANLHAATQRIVGGANTQAPSWMASLQAAYGTPPYVNFGHVCGASLIAAEWVVTAAHCVDGLTVAQIQVLVGSSRLSTAGYRSNIDQLVLHPQWQPLGDNTVNDPGSFANDIALLHLTEPLVNSPISLATRSQTLALTTDSYLTAYGWGAIDAAGVTKPEQLQSVTLPYLGFLMPQELPDHLFAGQVAGENICFGDSGGPLAQGNLLFGLASFVTNSTEDRSPCANPGSASGFTAIASHRAWLLAQQQGLTATSHQHLQVRSGDAGWIPFVIRNYSQASWELGQITSSSPLDAACQQTTLAPGDECTLAVAYSARDPGVTETIRIDYSATSSLGSQSNSLWLTVQNIDAATLSIQEPVRPAQNSSGGGSVSLLTLLALWLLPRRPTTAKRP